MGNCYSADHIAEDRIHTDLTCNIEEPQQKYRLGTVSNRLLGRPKLAVNQPALFENNSNIFLYLLCIFNNK